MSGSPSKPPPPSSSSSPSKGKGKSATGGGGSSLLLPIVLATAATAAVGAGAYYFMKSQSSPSSSSSTPSPSTATASSSSSPSKSLPTSSPSYSPTINNAASPIPASSSSSSSSSATATATASAKASGPITTAASSSSSPSAPTVIVSPLVPPPAVSASNATNTPAVKNNVPANSDPTISTTSAKPFSPSPSSSSTASAAAAFAAKPTTASTSATASTPSSSSTAAVKSSPPPSSVSSSPVPSNSSVPVASTTQAKPSAAATSSSPPSKPTASASASSPSAATITTSAVPSFSTPSSSPSPSTTSSSSSSVPAVKPSPTVAATPIVSVAPTPSPVVSVAPVVSAPPPPPSLSSTTSVVSPYTSFPSSLLSSFASLPSGLRCSTSGKVLISGGYLILESKFSGIVLGVSARFHAECWAMSEEIKNKLSEREKRLKVSNNNDLVFSIYVYSPQRESMVVEYLCTMSGESSLSSSSPSSPRLFLGFCTLERTTKGSEENKFVFDALLCYLLFLSSTVSSDILRKKFSNSLFIYLHGDQQFYSADVEAKSEENLSGKTGLGSSAALTAALVSSLMKYVDLYPTPAANSLSYTLFPSNLTPISLSSDESLLLIHNISQLSHSLAQGKIGSGFDISSALYGSHKYKRFEKEIFSTVFSDWQSYERSKTILSLQKLRNSIVNLVIPKSHVHHMGNNGNGSGNGNGHDGNGNGHGNEFVHVLTDNLGSILTKSTQLSCPLCESLTQWTHHVSPFDLPPSFSLLLFDVRGGAKTPTMVSKVLKWREEKKEESDKIWNILRDLNDKVETILTDIEKHYAASPSLYDSTLQSASCLPPTQLTYLNGSDDIDGDVISQLIHCRSTFLNVRALQRQMGVESDVEIEPTSQTSMLNFIMDQPGVVMAGCPGAGGFDAIFVIMTTKDKQKIQSLVQLVEKKYSDRNIKLLQVEKAEGGIQQGTAETQIHKLKIFQ